VQSADSLFGIKLIAGVLSALLFFLGVGVLFLYKIDAATGARMADELAERRKGYAS
jgi:Na+/melibiose symporter-like transporter